MWTTRTCERRCAASSVRKHRCSEVRDRDVAGVARRRRARPSPRHRPGAAVAADLRRPRVQPRPASSAATMTVSVAGRTVVAGDGSVVELALAAAPGEELPTWTAGAHIRVHLPSSRVREYSLCGDPDERGYRIAVRKVSDEGASGEVHSLALGQVLRISRPIKAFPLALPGHGSSAAAVHFIAAGIGITPILPMIMTAERWSVPWTLLYLGRSRHDLPYLDKLAAYGNRVTLRTDDESGVMTADELGDSLPPGAALYLCGPARFVDLAVARFGDAPECAELHFETIRRSSRGPRRGVHRVVPVGPAAGGGIGGRRHARRTGPGGPVDRLLLPPGVLRNVQAQDPRWRGHPSRFDPDRAGVGSRLHAALRVPGRRRRPRHRSVRPETTAGGARWWSSAV